MSIVTLGRTNISVEKNAFGALPIQRVGDFSLASTILNHALDNGITFFDTARQYSDSEEKLGIAFGGKRDKIIIATKTHAKTVDEFWGHLETSLNFLKTDYIDIYQFHNPAICYSPGDGTGMYEAMEKAKEMGKIRFIGITSHKLPIAIKAVESGLYDTLQFPFSYLASDSEIDLVNKCKAHNVGFICMKGLAGGLINNSAAAYAFINQYDNALPIWGVQSMKELNEFISYIKHPPALSEELKNVIKKDREMLIGSFCRACGYCLPCPANIEIPTAARMDLLTKRAALSSFRGAESQALMEKIEDCTNCKHCSSHCPYGLDTPNLLRENLKSYREYLKSDRP